MSIMQAPGFLRRILMVDAASSAALGALLTAAAPTLHGMLGLPIPLLRTAGMVLLPFAAFVAFVAMRPTVWRGGIWTVIACNVLWVVDSVGVLMSSQLQPTPLGMGFVIAQALFVALLAELEFIAIRKTGALTTA